MTISYEQLDKESIGKRIQNIRLTVGLNQADFATKIGVTSKQLVSSYENGRSIPDYNVLINIANFAKVSIDWILTGAVINEPPTNNPFDLASNVKNINLGLFPLVSRVTAGDYYTIIDEANVIEYVPVSYPNNKSSFLLEVEGDSMISHDGKYESIYPGDYILVDTQLIPQNGDLVVVLLEYGRQMVKKLINLNGKIQLLSYNRDYPPILLEKEQIIAIYRVVFVQPRGRKV